MSRQHKHHFVSNCSAPLVPAVARKAGLLCRQTCIELQYVHTSHTASLDSLSFLCGTEYVTKDIEDTPFDARSVNDRNATTLFLTEMIRGSPYHQLLRLYLALDIHKSIMHCIHLLYTVSQFVCVCVLFRSRSDSLSFLPRTSDSSVPIREGSSQSSVQRGTRTPSISQWRGEVHCLQTVRGCVPCSGEELAVYIVLTYCCTPMVVI